MTGKLALRKVRATKECEGPESLHSCLEEFIQIVRPLNQFEGDANEKQLLQLLSDESAGSEPDNESGDEAAARDNNIKEIPAVGAKAVPTHAKEPNQNINYVDERDQKEKVICNDSSGID